MHIGYMSVDAATARLDLLKIIELFGRHGVEYLVIGGQAAILHGSPQLTRDTDLCYRRTPENLERLAAALREMTDGFAGLDANLPTGAGQQQYHTVGVAVFPTPQVVLKLNYQKVIDGSPSGAMSDLILGGVGFHF